MANIVGSFFQAYPITGSFSRSAVNNAAGVKTPTSGIFTALLVVMSVELLTAALFWIPTVSLAAVIISSVLPMIEFPIVGHMWKTEKWELLTLAVTFFGCLFVGLEYGMLVAISISILYSLFRTSRARQKSSRIRDTTLLETQEEMNLYKGTRALIWCFEGPLLFYTSAIFSERLSEFVITNRDSFDTLVLDMRYVTQIDESGMNELEDSVKALMTSIDVRMCNVQDRLYQAILATEFSELTGIPADCIYPISKS